MHDPLTLTEMILRAALAMALGGMIGWDRERKEKAAGLRTMMLVALGAAGVMMAAMELAATMHQGKIELDPIRAISGIIGGVGFLGAGAIIHAGGSVKGLTTAASIWASAGIGVAVGAGLYRLAIVMAGLVFVTLVVITTLKGRVLPEKHAHEDGKDEESEGAAAKD